MLASAAAPLRSRPLGAVRSRLYWAGWGEVRDFVDGDPRSISIMQNNPYPKQKAKMQKPLLLRFTRSRRARGSRDMAGQRGNGSRVSVPFSCLHPTTLVTTKCPSAQVPHTQRETFQARAHGGVCRAQWHSHDMPHLHRQRQRSNGDHHSAHRPLQADGGLACHVHAHVHVHVPLTPSLQASASLHLGQAHADDNARREGAGGHGEHARGRHHGRRLGAGGVARAPGCSKAGTSAALDCT